MATMVGQFLFLGFVFLGPQKELSWAPGLSPLGVMELGRSPKMHMESLINIDNQELAPSTRLVYVFPTHQVVLLYMLAHLLRETPLERKA